MAPAGSALASAGRAPPPAAGRPRARRRPRGRPPRTRRRCGRASPAGATPQAIHSCARAYSMAKSAGWASVRSSSPVARSPRSPASIRRRSARPAGRPVEQSSRRSSPSSGTQKPRAAVDLLAEDRLGLVELAPHADVLVALAREQEGDRPARLGSRRRRRPAGVARPRRARRGVRAVAADQRPPVRRRPGGPRCRVKATSASGEAAGAAPGDPPGGRAVAARGAVRRAGREQPGAATAATAPEGAAAGASSSTTWALVPPMPNELTPARRGAPPVRPGAQPVVDEERAAREVDLRVGRRRSAGSAGSPRAPARAPP